MDANARPVVLVGEGAHRVPPPRVDLEGDSTAATAARVVDRFGNAGVVAL